MCARCEAGYGMFMFMRYSNVLQRTTTMPPPVRAAASHHPAREGLYFGFGLKVYVNSIGRFIS